MIDDFKKHIDGIVRRKLNAANKSFKVANLPSIQKGKKEELNYSLWLVKLLSQKMVSIHPYTQSQINILEILSFNVLYKQSFKSLCDSDHPAATEAIAKLGIDNVVLGEIVSAVKKFDQLALDYYDLFKGELALDGNTLAIVHNKITELSNDSAQGTIVSHSAKMTNPACRHPRVFSASTAYPDGFVRTGNSLVDFDMHINATKLKVFKFLSLKASGVSFLDLINRDNVDVLSNILSSGKDMTCEWIGNFKAKINIQDKRTHFAIKQIYFPFSNDYHQLSILTPSGLVFSLKEKIDYMNDQSKEAYLGKSAKKKKQYFNIGYSSISNLTVTRHGGDHPKNISGLNNKHQSYYLLLSLPPNLQHRDIHFPKTDFFNQTVNYFQCKHQFYQLHKLYSRNDNNMDIRAERDDYYQSIIDHIIEKTWQVRSVAIEQYNATTNQLPAAQQTWLCEQEESKSKRDNTDDWLDDIVKSATTFLLHGYEKILGKKAIKLGDAEYKHMQKLVLSNKEALR